MKALLVDFGSTYTKVSLVNLDPPALIGTSRAPTTTKTGLLDGLTKALEAFAPEQLEDTAVKKACSSAAGGLRVVAIGLVPELTVKAAREAALGAGARVVATYAYTLTEEEMDEIKELDPDLLLLSGGTDGGDRKNILENAARIAESGLSVPVVVAGNKAAASDVKRILKKKNPCVVVTSNVMPEVNVLQVEPARQAIRELYLQEITKAKGLDVVQQEIGLAMPTPLAVMKAGELLSEISGEGVVIVDVGGATTDVHSFCDGTPRKGGCVLKGLPEPFAKRTVEGDLGMRVSLQTLLDVIEQNDDIDINALRDYANRVSREFSLVASNDRERFLDGIFAAACIREALRRHSGQLNEVFTPEGRLWIQKGKDLTEVDILIGTGGALVFADDPENLLRAGLRLDNPLYLTPRHPELMLDHNYVLYAVGLLAEDYPETAEALLKETLISMGRV